MGLVAAGLSQELLVALLQHGVQVALAQGHALILVVQGLSAQLLDVVEAVVHRALHRLAAAVDTAAGAAHDLDKLVIGLARADLLQQGVGVGIGIEKYNGIRGWNYEQNYYGCQRVRERRA